ncbi:MAG TPA: hypothetical protein VFT70_10540 [Nocardioides sp.]|nr:hypothetical protein [Nocardioides sp.]
MSELDVLRRLGDQVEPPPFEALRATARRRDRRAAAITGVAVVAAVAAMSLAGLYIGRDDARQPEPAPAPAPDSRPLTYADGSAIHYGDRTVVADGPVVELDVTDDGVGFRTDDGRIWFTDGTRVDSLGALGETGPGYGDTWPLTSHPGWMLSSNSGSRLVWFEFPDPGRPEVVVYDTGSGHEVARDAVRLAPGHTAVPALLSDNSVYWFEDPDPEEMPEDQTQVRYEPGTGEQSRVTEADLLDDLDTDAATRSVRLKGDGRADSSHAFHYSDGMGLQMDMGLQKDVAGVDGVAPVGPGDMVAEDVRGQPFAFEPPPGYTDRSGVAWLVQWLDDETVVVLSPLRSGTDLVACHLDTTTCEVEASLPPGIVAPDVGTSQFIG